MLEACNDKKSSNGAVSSQGLLDTMKSQQAVAIRFVGRRVTHSTCLFFILMQAFVMLEFASIFASRESASTR